MLLARQVHCSMGCAAEQRSWNLHAIWQVKSSPFFFCFVFLEKNQQLDGAFKCFFVFTRIWGDDRTI